ncbi:MAG: PHP domain-containing protein [Candidatus Hodarchaeota archaeon]
MTDNQYLYDLHLHIAPLSRCSILSFDDMCNNISNRLRGFAITDHDYIPPPSKVKQQREVVQDKLGMRLFYGSEITTNIGHLLVFGILKIPSRKLSAKKLINLVHDSGGVVVAAHPWRNVGYPWGGIAEKVYEYDIDALEINGQATKKQNDKAQIAAKELNLPTTGGSDAHSIKGLNKVVTLVSKPLFKELDLIKEILNKRTVGIYL